MAGRVSNAVSCCCTYSASLRLIAPSQQAKRSFTSSRSLQDYAPLPILRTSDSAPQELKNLLLKIRNTIIIPGHLNVAHKDLIFKTRNHPMLISDPVTVKLGDEDHTLQPLVHTRDIPHYWGSLENALKLMGSSAEDWRGSFLGLLEGFQTAGKRWRLWQWERLVRLPGQKGLVGMVVEAARRGERTGLSLKEVRLSREVLWGCRILAMYGGENTTEYWEEGRTLEALRYAEQVAQLLELDKHCGGAIFKSNQVDPRVQTDCMGVFLELAATRAQKHLGGKDEDGKVRMYAERLVTNLQKRVGEEMDRHGKKLAREGLFAAAADYELKRWVPVMNGLEVASNVLGAEMPLDDFSQTKLKELKLKVQGFDKQVVDAGDAAKIERRQGWQWLQDLQRS